MSDRPLQYDPSSTRGCLACGHPVAHGFALFGAACCSTNEQGEGTCNCTENDRLIADLRAELAETREKYDIVSNAVYRYVEIACDVYARSLVGCDHPDQAELPE